MGYLAGGCFEAFLLIFFLGLVGRIFCSRRMFWQISFDVFHQISVHSPPSLTSEAGLWRNASVNFQKSGQQSTLLWERAFFFSTGVTKMKTFNKTIKYSDQPKAGWIFVSNFNIFYSSPNQFDHFVNLYPSLHLCIEREGVLFFSSKLKILSSSGALCTFWSRCSSH